jgi:hypothetical protein
MLRNSVNGQFNSSAALPFELRLKDFELAIQDVYDLFYDINLSLVEKGLQRIEDMLERRKATLSGLLSDLLTASLAKHSRVLVENRWPNGRPDLVVKGRYPNDAVKAGVDGIEIKSTKNKSAAVDMHGARDQWLCVFAYRIDSATEPANDRRPLEFIGVYLAEVVKSSFRKNARGELGTRTATLDREGIKGLRSGWIYRLE